MAQVSTPDDVLDAALALADEIGWRNVTAHAIGARLGGGPGLVIAHYNDLDEIADAWFQRALADALSHLPDPALPFPERLAHVFGRWLDALSPHRQASLDMIQGKLTPSHPHHWVPLAFSLSRLVHWMLDTAACEATGRRRQATEVMVSALVPAALLRWKRGDDQAVKDYVTDKLQRMERRLDRLWPQAFKSASP